MLQRPIDALVIAVLAVLLAIVSTFLALSVGVRLPTEHTPGHLPGLFLVLYVLPIGIAVLAVASLVHVITESKR